MEPFTTYQLEGNFSVAMSDSSGVEFDNKDAMGNRFSLLFVESGSGIATLNGNAIPYIAPCLFCINEKEHLRIPSSDGAKMRALYFHPSIINSFLNYDNIRNLPEDVPFTFMQDNDLIKFFLDRHANSGGKFNLGPFSAKKIVKLLDGIHKLITEQYDPNWPCRSRSYVFELLFLLDNLYSSDDFTDDTYPGNIKEEFYPILLYVYHNFEKKLSVTDVTDQFHISRPTLSKMFQDNLGETFVAYLNKLRVTMAATLLRDTMLPVQDIMSRVGFSDNAHFLRTFKKFTGTAPTLYRDKYNWM